MANRFNDNQRSRSAPPADREELREALARMWLMVDPNRQPAEPYRPMSFENSDGPATPPLNGEPYWKWFLPRADASIEFLRALGFEVVKRP